MNQRSVTFRPCSRQNNWINVLQTPPDLHTHRDQLTDWRWLLELIVIHENFCQRRLFAVPGVSIGDFYVLFFNLFLLHWATWITATQHFQNNGTTVFSQRFNLLVNLCSPPPFNLNSPFGNGNECYWELPIILKVPHSFEMTIGFLSVWLMPHLPRHKTLPRAEDSRRDDG